jgi:hypothetical protein
VPVRAQHVVPQRLAAELFVAHDTPSLPPAAGLAKLDVPNQRRVREADKTIWARVRMVRVPPVAVEGRPGQTRLFTPSHLHPPVNQRRNRIAAHKRATRLRLGGTRSC